MIRYIKWVPYKVCTWLLLHNICIQNVLFFTMGYTMREYGITNDWKKWNLESIDIIQHKKLKCQEKIFCLIKVIDISDEISFY